MSTALCKSHGKLFREAKTVLSIGSRSSNNVMKENSLELADTG